MSGPTSLALTVSTAVQATDVGLVEEHRHTTDVVPAGNVDAAVEVDRVQYAEIDPALAEKCCEFLARVPLKVQCRWITYQAAPLNPFVLNLGFIDHPYACGLVFLTVPLSSDATPMGDKHRLWSPLAPGDGVNQLGSIKYYSTYNSCFFNKS